MIDIILVPWFGAFATGIVCRFTKKFGYVPVLTSLIALLLTIWRAPAFLTGVVTLEIWAQAPYGIALEADAFNGTMALLAGLIFTLVAIYSVRYIGEDEKYVQFYALYQLFVAGTLGIILTGDIFNMFVLLEIASISSYALVSYALDKESVAGGLRYMLISALGTSIFLLGVTFLYALAGTLNIAHLVVMLQGVNTPVLFAAFSFLFIGVGVKAAVIPLYLWKPKAISATPIPVATLVSGISTATAVYILMRLTYTIFSVYSGIISSILLYAGVLTMLLGAFMALLEPDVKKVLAYSGISQVGYAFLAIGFATASGIFAGIFHIINVVLGEALIFLSLGYVILHTGEKNLHKLGGLAPKMPLAAAAFLFGSLSVVGVPPLNGFASKWLIYLEGISTNHILATAVALVVSALTLGYYMKAFSAIFLGPGKWADFKSDWRLDYPILILLALCLVIGIYPPIIYPLLQPATDALLTVSGYLGVLA
ncbi:MAG: proton-conducting transporter membrane subunit [archaeon]